MNERLVWWIVIVIVSYERWSNEVEGCAIESCEWFRQASWLDVSPIVHSYRVVPSWDVDEELMVSDWLLSMKISAWKKTLVECVQRHNCRSAEICRWMLLHCCFAYGEERFSIKKSSLQGRWGAPMLEYLKRGKSLVVLVYRTAMFMKQSPDKWEPWIDT